MIGVLALVAFLILPGMALLRPKKDEGIFGALALGFGFSIALLVTVFGALTGLTGSINQVHLVAAAILALAGLFIVVRRRADYGGLLTRGEISLAIVAAVYFVLLFTDFLKYPIFPRTPSQDFANHLAISRKYVAGTLSPLEDGYPPGVRFVIGLSVLLGGESMAVMRGTMALIGGLQLFMVYLIGLRLLGRKKAILAPIIYVLLGAHWIIALFHAGLYANFVADTLIMVLVYLLIEEVERPSRKSKILILLSSTSLLLTHYVYWIFVFSVWLSSLIGLAARFSSRELKSHLKVLLIVVMPSIPVLVLRGEAVLGLLGLYSAPDEGAGLLIYGQSLLRLSLKEIAPFLLYLSAALGSDLLLILVLVALASTLYRAFRNQARSWMPLVYLWFISAWVLSPHNAYAWRFSTYAQVPLVFILANFADMMGSRLFARFSKLQKFNFGTAMKVMVAAASVTFVIYNSPLSPNLADVADQPLREAAEQRRLYESFDWITRNTPREATVLSVTNWRYPYVKTLTDRDAITPPIVLPEIALLMVRNADRPVSYVLLDKGLYASVYNTFSGQKDFEAVWENESIVIFQKKTIPS